MTTKFQVRVAAEPDVDTVMSFLGKKADFDRAIGAFAGEISATASLIGKALFGQPAHAHSLLVEGDDGVFGFAFYYFRFSSFAGRPSLWLDDLYIDQARRRGGAGSALMRALAEAALERGCPHLAWTADERNSEGMTFYRKLGATVVQRIGLSVTWRIAPDVLRAATSS